MMMMTDDDMMDDGWAAMLSIDVSAQLRVSGDVKMNGRRRRRRFSLACRCRGA
jgi:hypothetical protein